MTAPHGGVGGRIGRLHPTAIVGTAAGVAVVLVAVLLVLHHSGSDGKAGATPSPSDAPNVVTASPLPPNAARDWMNAAITDFNPVKGILISFTKTTNGWRAGTVTDVQEAAELKNDLPFFLQTRTALGKRTVFAKAPLALNDYRQSVTLYIQAARMASVATRTPKGALHAQLSLSYARLQNLADRVFDQAAVELAPYLPPPVKVDGVVITKPAEVPDWASLSLAAGEPLGTTPAKTPVRRYEESRPQQGFAAWKSDVGSAGIPSAPALAAGITGGSTQALRTMSDAFVHASSTLYGDADPKGERSVATRVELSLLVDSEASRAAEAATLAPTAVRADLIRIAQSLALVGDALWDDRLGTRHTGFATTLLTT